jgi:hypothetical protein
VDTIEQLVAKAKRAGWGYFDGDNFPNSFAMLWASVDDILDPKFETEQRRTHLKAFVEDAAFGHLSLYEFEGAIGRIPIGGAYRRGDVFKNPRELCQALNKNERDWLQLHYLEKVEAVQREFPDLVREFPGQFRK